MRKVILLLPSIGSAVLLASGVVLVGIERTAHAAFPGANGKIAFTSTRDGNPQIYVVNSDGSNVNRLTDGPAINYAPSFSPNGEKIAFTSERDEGHDEIYVMNSDGSDQTRLTNTPANDYVPSFSPDGTRIVFTSGRDRYYKIYSMNSDGSDQTHLTDNVANDFQPAFSADGEKVTFVSDRDGNQEIYVMDQDGSDQIRLTEDGAYDYLPDWQPLSEPTLPTSQAECKTGGYNKFGFKNQGICIALVQRAPNSR